MWEKWDLYIFWVMTLKIRSRSPNVGQCISDNNCYQRYRYSWYTHKIREKNLNLVKMWKLGKFKGPSINQFFEFSKIGPFRPGSIPRAHFHTFKHITPLAVFPEPCSNLFWVFAKCRHLGFDLLSKFSF